MGHSLILRFLGPLSVPLLREYTVEKKYDYTVVLRVILQIFLNFAHLKILIKTHTKHVY